MSDDEFLELSQSDFELYMKLPVCGCGYSGQVYDIYRRMLRYAEHPGQRPLIERLDDFHQDEALYNLAAGVLDGIGATEHGSNIAYAWITDIGRALLDILDRYAVTDYDAIPCMAAGSPKGPQT